MTRHAAIESVLNSFPEVTWDRWAGTSVFGWIPREDGRSDFVVVRIEDGRLTSVLTSSATCSEIFSKRLSLSHSDCRRVEHDFPNVKSVKLTKS